MIPPSLMEKVRPILRARPLRFQIRVVCSRCRVDTIPFLLCFIWRLKGPGILSGRSPEGSVLGFTFSVPRRSQARPWLEPLKSPSSPPRPGMTPFQPNGRQASWSPPLVRGFVTWGGCWLPVAVRPLFCHLACPTAAPKAQPGPSPLPSCAAK